MHAHYMTEIFQIKIDSHQNSAICKIHSPQKLLALRYIIIIHSCVYVCVLTSIEQTIAAIVKKIVEKLTIGQTIAITSVGMK